MAPHEQNIPDIHTNSHCKTNQKFSKFLNFEKVHPVIKFRVRAMIFTTFTPFVIIFHVEFHKMYHLVS